MTVLYDPQVMQALAQACQAANDELQRAQSLILAVRSHEDWGCREKDAIDDLMGQCRNYVNTLCEEQRSFLEAVKIVETDLNEAEGKISGLFQSVDNVIAGILAVPAPTTIATGFGLFGGAIHKGAELVKDILSGGGAGHLFGSSGVQHGGGAGHSIDEALNDLTDEASLVASVEWLKEMSSHHTGEMYNYNNNHWMDDWADSVASDFQDVMGYWAQGLIPETRGGMDHLLDPVVPVISQPFLETLQQDQPLLELWKGIKAPITDTVISPSMPDHMWDLSREFYDKYQDVLLPIGELGKPVVGTPGFKVPDPVILVQETVPVWGKMADLVGEVADGLTHTGYVREIAEIASQIPVTMFEDLRL